MIKASLLAMIVTAYQADANILLSDTATTSIDVGGEVLPICKVQNNVKSRATSLDLTSTAAQKTNNVFIWCNTGDNSASATYSSANNGNLVNENGDSIPYLVTIPNTESNFSLATAHTVTQRAGNGIDGNKKGRVVKIKPQVNGFEYAGTYSDTITVTVAVN